MLYYTLVNDMTSNTCDLHNAKRGDSFMTLSLKHRVEILESRVDKLQVELNSAGRVREKDWRRTIGAFTDDEGMQAILQEAIRQRDMDRQNTFPKRRGKRTNKQ
jgi:hypothetical protein